MVADGKIAVSMADPKQFLGMIEAVRMDSAAFGARLKAGEPMDALRAEAGGEIEARLGRMTKQEVFDRCMAAGTPCGKFNTREELMADPQAVHNGTIETHSHPTLGEWRTPKPPATFVKTPSAVEGAPATFGEHTAEVLAELGVAAADIAQLQADGVVGGRP